MKGKGHDEGKDLAEELWKDMERESKSGQLNTLGNKMSSQGEVYNIKIYNGER